MKLFFLALNLFLATEINAQWWNPLAEKTYDDCVLENIKDSMGEDAVLAVQRACYSKYGENSKNQRPKSDPEAKKREDCGVNSDTYKSWISFSNEKGNNNNEFTISVLDKIATRSYDTKKNVFEFQNNNNFGISGVKLGFTKSESCGTYAVSTFCSSSRTTSGVGSSSYGKLSCNYVPSDIGEYGYCVTGYSPVYDQFDWSIYEFGKNNGYCD
jgi:hypothetical protein